MPTATNLAARLTEAIDTANSTEELDATLDLDTLIAIRDYLAAIPAPVGYAVGTLARSAHHPGDRALRDVTRAITVARRENVSEHELYSFIANGLTGAINGYRERLLATALRDAAAPIIDLTQDEARAIERSRREDEAAAALRHQRARAQADEDLTAEWADVDAGTAFDHDNRGE